MDNFFNIIFGIWVLLCIAGWTAQTFLVRRIKRDHHEKWAALGKPMEVHKFFLACIIPSGRNAFGGDFSLLRNNYRSMFLLLKYYYKGDTELDADKNVLKLKNINRVLIFTMISVFLGAILFSFFYTGQV